MASYKKQLRAKLWYEQDRRCCWCSQRIGFDEATIEHLRARACDGKNDSLNLAVACRECNHSRGERLNRALTEKPEPVKRKPKYVPPKGKKLKDRQRGRKRVVDRTPPVRYYKVKSKEMEVVSEIR